MVDELLLGLEPFTPAHATDSLVGATAQIVLEGLECHPLPIQPATSTVQRNHGGKIDVSRNVIQSIVGSLSRR